MPLTREVVGMTAFLVTAVVALVVISEVMRRLGAKLVTTCALSLVTIFVTVPLTREVVSVVGVRIWRTSRKPEGKDGNERDQNRR